MNDTSTVSKVASHPKRFSFDTLAVWALLISFGLAIIAFIPSTTIPFIFTKVSVLALGGLIALACYILARLSRGNIVVPPVPLLGALWLVPIAYILSTLFSGVTISRGVFGNTFESDTLSFIVILASFATLTAVCFRRSNQYKTFFKVAGILFGVIVAVQVMFILLGQITEKVSPTVNLVGSFGDLGMMVGLGLVISLLTLRFQKLSPRVEKTLWSLTGLSLLLLALANSRLTWLLVSFVALGLFIEAIMRRRGEDTDEDFEGVIEMKGEEDSHYGASDTRGLAAPLVTLVVGLFFLIGSGTIGASLSSAVGINYLDVRPSWQSTFAIGGHTYAASPLFGSGPGTFVEEWSKFRDRSLNETVFWNTDFNAGIGYIPTSFVTTGILGALAWMLFLGLFLYVGLRALLFKTPEESYARFTSIASFIGAWYVLLLAFFSVPGPIVLAAGFFLIGLFISSLRYAGERREWGIIFSKNPRVGFVIVFILTLTLLATVAGAYAVIERYLGTLALARANSALGVGNVAEAEIAVNQAIVYAETDSAYQLMSNIGILAMNRIAGDSKLRASEAQEQFQNALTESIAAATRATLIAPNNYQNWLALGNVYQTVVPLRIEGAYQNAKDAYTKAGTLNPNNPTIPFTLAQLEIAEGKASLAVEYLERAIGLKRDYTQAILLLSQLQVGLGKAPEALQAAEAAAYFAPRDSNVLFQVGILRQGTGDVDGAISALARSVEINPEYANARFFLAVSYSIKGDAVRVREQLTAIAAFSPENAQAIAPYLEALNQGRNPFPDARTQSLLTTPVKDQAEGGTR